MTTGLIFFWSGIKKNVFGDKGLPPNNEVYEKPILGIPQKTFIPLLATLFVPVIAYILSSYKSITTGRHSNNRRKEFSRNYIFSYWISYRHLYG